MPPSWLEHTTTACPVPPDTPTTIQLRSGRIIETNKPQHWLWGRAPGSNPGEIVAYRAADAALTE